MLSSTDLTSAMLITSSLSQGMWAACTALKGFVQDAQAALDRLEDVHDTASRDTMHLARGTMLATIDVANVLAVSGPVVVVEIVLLAALTIVSL